MFDVGDEVYSKKFGEGVVICVDDNDLYLYPIHVQWKNSSKRDIFTPEGRYNIHLNDPDTDIAHTFKLMNRVFYPYYGKGTVVGDSKTDVPYPIRVFWDKPYFADEPYSSFTRDGRMSLHMLDGDENFKLMLLKDVPKEETGGSEMGQIAGSVNHNIQDGVAPWGKFFEGKKDEKMMGLDDKIFHALIHDLMQKKDEDTVERMEDALNKKVEDAVNPSHYRVEGLPDTIDIINHLMHREQYEGFLWGNILKYAYRYGRKGDKAETAGKIEWYARQLKELAEVMKNDSEGTHGVGEEE